MSNITLAERAQLTILYGEPQRHYHNLAHILHCLRELHDLNSNVILSTTDFHNIERAIWYHDAVYDTQAKPGCNERASASLLSSDETNDAVRKMILATIDHVVTADTDLATKYFLDIDMAILGQHKDIYTFYMAGIEREFSWVPRKIYYSARSAILETIIAGGDIYNTEFFRSKYEDVARYNISMELDMIDKAVARLPR